MNRENPDVREQRQIAEANAQSLRAMATMFGRLGGTFGHAAAADLDRQAERFEQEASR